MTTIINKIISLLIISSLIILPVFFLPITPEFFITGKFYLITLAVFIILILLIIKLFFSHKIKLINSVFNKPLILLSIAYLLSIIIISPNKYQALFVIPTGLASIIILSLYYFIIINSESFIKNPVRIIELMVPTALIAALLRIVYFFNPLSAVKLPSQWQFLTNAFFSPLGNQFDLLFFLGFFVIYFVIKLYQDLTADKNNKGLFNNSLLNIIVAAIAIVALVITAMPILQQSKIISAISNNNPSQEAAAYNLPPFNISWYAAVETLKNPKNALFGVGVDNYLSLFTLVKPTSYNLSPLWQLNFSTARSALLHVWAEVGLFGLLTMFLIFLFAIREAVWLYTKNHPQKTLISGLLFYILIIYILFPPQFITYFLLFITLAILTLLAINSEPEKNHYQTYDLANYPLIKYSLIVIFLLITGTGGWFLWRNYLAEYYIKQSYVSILKNQAKNIYDNQRQAIRINPYQESYHRTFSQINLLLANGIAKKKDITNKDRNQIQTLIKQSIDEAKIAVRLNPQKVSNWIFLGNIYRSLINVAANAPNWAAATYQQGVVRDPNNPVLRFNLGGIYYSQKNYNLSTQYFTQSITLKRDWANAYYNLAWSLYQNKNYTEAYLAMNRTLQLLDKSAPDYQKAQKDFEEFKKALPSPEDATKAGQLKPQPALNQQPLSLPQTPISSVSPQIKLPESAGPEATSEAN